MLIINGSRTELYCFDAADEALVGAAPADCVLVAVMFAPPVELARKEGTEISDGKSRILGLPSVGFEIESLVAVG
jgi:hypothetical protein